MYKTFYNQYIKKTIRGQNKCISLLGNTIRRSIEKTLLRILRNKTQQ